ncbi:Starch-binding associating with outer membrane [Draconibacterium orientale]|uniref:Glycan metabolism protein RagB n=1 Tax=Draconibacterium orientale TaxID=1168034 RepID=X5DEM7_9BACT|nr:RagB/SusD family nutrient uptake outer membrane protein [Draconibacterium orientale]AHW58792.1 glycan metabolism protein RagB [Draconibacterium orientale]SET48437.1 Starch-binding associating with outer membrane [Draconibacterium orientale]
MKNIHKTLLKSGVLFIMLLGLFSCEEYLDKAPESIVSEEVAFSNFTNFQGYIEEIYNCIPDKEKKYWTTSWNWGDDELFNLEGSWHMTNQVDIGNFWAWQNNAGTWLDDDNANPTSTNKFDHGLWAHAWYCIRKANMGLENLDLLTVATQEERDFIEGQLYFFRAWWHFEMMQYFGGLPYIDQVLPSGEKLTLPRLSYQECADKAGADLRKAANLLPIDWDETTVGKNTLGKNQLRANKIMALGYLGKNYLWAASPLMKNGAETGGANTYNYDEDYARKAAEAFGELLSLVESGQTQYSLVDFDYDDIYNHKKASGVESKYSDMFYTTGQNWLMPGSTEAIFRGPSTDYNGSNWNTTKTFGPKVKGLVEHDNIIHHPTANYVKNYGMANGLPLDDPESGFDPEYPFKDRDPRFYHDIVFDGFKYVNATMPADMEYLRYTGLATNGTMRNPADGSRTGYLIQKLVPHTANKYDGAYNWSYNLHTYLPYMRLGDIYTMYAEACAAFGGASGKASNFSKTAEEAINTLRDRCGAGHVAASYTASREKFIDEVRRERAVELSFEGFRFNDLQRWLLLTEYPYNVKTSQEFDRVENLEFFENNDPRDARVANFREEVILTRQFGVKHYWFPLKIEDVSMYPEFGQNPGW